jgi:tetratricopeptide (TPR) repeat protein
MSRGEPDIKALFTAALELPEGPERDAHLVAACGGDDGLRRRVEDLLAAFARASDVLGPAGTPAAAIADEATTNADEASGTAEPARRTDLEATDARAHAPDSSPGIDHGPETAPGEPGTTAPRDDRGIDRNGDDLAPGSAVRYFGDYEIRRELGRGGMGVVYEARQVSLNRPVALKMVKAGLLAGDDELRRFRNEAEAVALLDHPGVVPVYEVGEHDGRQYFSMKLVAGGSLVPLIDRYTHDPRAAARLVAEAAEAVAHAHARGLLHRDLKPANILVDAEGHPHVTDFGLAKKVQADVELTQSGAILGTPAYMSPEQADGHRGAVTTASDVYGLGAVLYALLTGRAPFGGDSVVETLDAVRHAPPRPPTRLNAAVPRDLETICLKCLEKDPRRRYPTAQALAEDLRAWLDSRPITARRVGAAERAWLWCRRRPAVAALAAAVALALVGGTAAVIAVQARANADLRAANLRVQQRYELAVEAIKTFHTGVSKDFLLKQDQFKELRDRLLKSAADFYGKLGALLGQETDRASRRALAASNFELAGLSASIGRAEDALAVHQSVLAAREALAAEPGAGLAAKVEVGRSLTAVAWLLHTTGKTGEALEALRRAESRLAGPAGTDAEARAALAACRTDLGELLSITGRKAEALAAYRQARADQEALAAALGATDDTRLGLADTVVRIGFRLAETGRPEEGVAELRAALAIGQRVADDHPADAAFRGSLAGCHGNLGLLLRWTGRPAEAEAELRAAQAIGRKLAAEMPGVTGLRRGLAAGHHNLGWLLLEMRRPAEAEAELRAALAIHRKLADDDPARPEFRQSLAYIHNNLGMLLYTAGKPAEAEAEIRTALELFRKLDDGHPAVTEFSPHLADIHTSLGVVLRDTGRPSEAEPELRAALAICRKLADDDMNMMRAISAYNGLGWMLAQTGKPSQAEAELRAVLALYRKRAEANPQAALLRDAAARIDNNLSAVLRRLGRPAEARDHCERAVAVREALVKVALKTPVYRGSLAGSCINRGLARRALGDPAGAAADVRRATALYDTLRSRSGEEWFLSACAHAALAGLAGQAGAGVAAAEGEEQAARAMGSLHKAVAMGYRSRDAYRNEDALDPLRGRDDFRLLMMDLAFPAEPFAPTEPIP